MLLTRLPLDDESCPVRDELLGEMYRANKHGLTELVATVAPDVRAMLALFCYRRSHLQSLALTIAGSCDEADLVRSGGTFGAVLFANAQRAQQPSPVAPHHGRKITLSTGPLRPPVPADDDPDEEAGDSAVLHL